MMKILLFLEIS